MLDFDLNNLSTLVIAGITALIALSFSLQSLVKYWKNNSAEGSLLKMMHEELERMCSQNTTLSLEIGELQFELVKLSAQLSTLTHENQKLQAEVSQLNAEIARLHSIVAFNHSMP